MSKIKLYFYVALGILVSGLALLTLKKSQTIKCLQIELEIKALIERIRGHEVELGKAKEAARTSEKKLIDALALRRTKREPGNSKRR